MFAHQPCVPDNVGKQDGGDLARLIRHFSQYNFIRTSNIHPLNIISTLSIKLNILSFKRITAY